MINYRDANDYGKFDPNDPAAVSAWQERQPSQAMSLTQTIAADEAAKKQASAAQIESMMGSANGPVDASYSNYQTGPGTQLPQGMAMMGEEPRQPSVEEFLVKNGAREIVGKDPYAEAWAKTVNDWQGWFDIVGGDPQPFNPHFRAVYGKQFDKDLQAYQAEAIAERNKGMEKITKLLNNFQPSMDRYGTPTPNATEADVMKGLGVKALPGAPEALDYQGGIKDASGKEEEKYAKAEDRRLYRESLAEAKKTREDPIREKAMVTEKSSRLKGAYADLESNAKRKLGEWKKRLTDAEKNGGDEAETYITSYRTSIENLTGFLDNLGIYKDLDLDAVSRMADPLNIVNAQKYWEAGVGKLDATGKIIPKTTAPKDWTFNR